MRGLSPHNPRLSSSYRPNSAHFGRRCGASLRHAARSLHLPQLSNRMAPRTARRRSPLQVLQACMPLAQISSKIMARGPWVRSASSVVYVLKGRSLQVIPLHVHLKLRHRLALRRACNSVDHSSREVTVHRPKQTHPHHSPRQRIIEYGLCISSITVKKWY